AYLNVALPKILGLADRPYQSLPMERVGPPSSIFDSQGLYDLQRYSDSIGGLFSPLGGANKTQAKADPNAAILSQLDFAALVKAINPMFGMTNTSGQLVSGGASGGLLNKQRQNKALEDAFAKYAGTYVNQKAGR